jgi:hypothetical protein
MKRCSDIVPLIHRNGLKLYLSSVDLCFFARFIDINSTGFARSKIKTLKTYVLVRRYNNTESTHVLFNFSNERTWKRIPLFILSLKVQKIV